jgi:hypothetical protein
VLLGNGDGTFGTRTDFGTGSHPDFVAIGDLNGDERPDLAVANWVSNTVSVLLGNGDGTFRSKLDFGTGFVPDAVAIGDLNGDGRPDLAVANFGSNTVSVHLGEGGGTFGAKTDYGTGRWPGSVTMADLNGDGRLDLAAVNVFSSTVTLLLNRGVTTPVTVENLEAVAIGARVQLHWRLSGEARRRVQRITVERAPAADGPYLPCNDASLEPAITMSFEDVGVPRGSYWYRLVLISRDGSLAHAGPVSVHVGGDAPRVTALHQLFEPAAGGPIEIRYSVAQAWMPVELAIYDVRGSVVWSSTLSVREPGEYAQTWDRRVRSGALAPRGVYFVRLAAGGVTDRKKFAILRR